jgi:ATP phosphoribosyltransferase
MLNIALPKGRLGRHVYGLLERVGYRCDGVADDSRRLIFENPAAGVRYFLVKPTDVATYVARGAADVGVAGKDSILESGAEVYELLDLGVGCCRMAIAAQNGFSDDRSGPLRVATKYPNIARAYFQQEGREIELITLHGSIELAPLLGLSDVIVDIVETGTTLRENDLSVISTIMEISARLIAGRASYRFHEAELAALTKRLSEACGK